MAVHRQRLQGPCRKQHHSQILTAGVTRGDCVRVNLRKTLISEEDRLNRGMKMGIEAILRV